MHKNTEDLIMYSQEEERYLDKEKVQQITQTLFPKYPKIAQALSLLYDSIEWVCNKFKVEFQSEGFVYQISVIAARPVLETRAGGILVGANILLGLVNKYISTPVKIGEIFMAVDEEGYTNYDAFLYVGENAVVIGDQQLPLLMHWIRTTRVYFQDMVEEVMRSGSSSRKIKRQATPETLSQSMPKPSIVQNIPSTPTMSAMPTSMPPGLTPITPPGLTPITPPQAQAPITSPQGAQLISRDSGISKNIPSNQPPAQDSMISALGDEDIPPLNLESTSKSKKIRIPDGLFAKSK